MRDTGEEFTPAEVKARLISEGGWKATVAQEVEEIAQKVLKYKRLRKGSRIWRSIILKIWRGEAAKESMNERD